MLASALVRPLHRLTRLARALPGLLALPLTLASATALHAQIGGGFTYGGIVGEYFANADLSGSPAFTRREVRLDFDWGNALPIGGSIAEPYRSFPRDNFSARYTGVVIPSHSETYTFKLVADDGVRLFLRPAGSPTWTPLIDAWTALGTHTATAALTAGQRYELRVEYRELAGDAALRLLWSSPGVPEEVVDCVAQLGFNFDATWSQAFTDLVKCARPDWEGVDGSPKPAQDADGWPLADASYVFQESLNQGLDLDPLTRGTVAFSFKGRGTVSLFGNVDYASLAQSYDAATNTTSGSFRTQARGSNASNFIVRNTDRDGQLPVRKNGITDLRLLKPVAPDATASYAPTTLFDTRAKAAAETYTLLRVSLNNANQERTWADRTRPAFFNQNRGKQTPNFYADSWQAAGASRYGNGASWEHKVMLCNETGRDLYLNLPMMADGWAPGDNGYVEKLARLLRYGSDGVEPYSSPQADPLYPPLNPNLRVYVEFSNELWNAFSDAFRQHPDLIRLVKADANAALGFGSDDSHARPQDFAIYNFDNLSTAQNSNGDFSSQYTWAYRKLLLRTIQASDIFRATFGDAAMHTRVRPLYMWQYGDLNSTASDPLRFADRYFNHADGVARTPTAYPVSRYIWGGGGASYYGARNPYGVTSALANSGFESPALPAGYTLRPTDAGWVFSGASGIARDGGDADDIPPAALGSQVAYVQATGALERTVVIPSTPAQVSNRYAFVFRAVQRVKLGAPLDGNGNPVPDAQKLFLRVNGQPSNANSFNQNGTGFVPVAWNSQYPWESRIVFWTRGTTYYSSNTFTAAPGDTVTVRIEGLGGADDLAFIDDVRLCSVDQLHGDGIPGGGEALGQPSGTEYLGGLHTQSSWAHAYGLRYMTYEGGWSLGGDTGGSPLQLHAKYKDARARSANLGALEMFARAGGLANTLGTYAQWPTWSDFTATEGLENITNVTLVQGQLDFLDRLPDLPDHGRLLPATYAWNDRTLHEGVSATGGFDNRDWATWHLVVPQSAAYRLELDTTTGGQLRLLLDDATLLHAGPSGGTVVLDNVFLTRGLHSLKLRSTSGAFSFTALRAGLVGALAAPTLSSLTDSDLALTATWSGVAGATGYRIRYGTTSGAYTGSLDLGPEARSATLAGLAHDTTYYVVVHALNAAGPSLPSAERSATVLAHGQPGRLAQWDFRATSSLTGNSPTAAPVASSSQVAVGALTRGAGFPAAGMNTASDRGNFNANHSPASATLAEARSANRYIEWTLAPADGLHLAVSAVRLALYHQAGNAAFVTLEVSADGFATAGIPLGSAQATGTNWSGVVRGFDASSVPLLQGSSGTLTFRAYFHGYSAWNDIGVGGVSGFNPDIEIIGTVFEPGPPPLPPVALSAAALASDTIILAWPDIGPGESGYSLQSKTTSAGAWTFLADLPANTTSWTHTGLSPGTNYLYRLAARNANGTSDWSPEANATTRNGTLQTTFTLTALADAHARGGTSQNTNYGGNAQLELRSTANTSTGLNNARKAWLKFDLSGLPANFTSATLKLTYTGASTGFTSDRRLNLYLVADGADTWSESSLTWANAPANLTGNGSGGDAGFLDGAANLLAQLTFSPTPAAGTVFSLADSRLLSALNTRRGADGLLTLALGATTSSGGTFAELQRLATRDHATYAGPTLELSAPAASSNTLYAPNGLSASATSSTRIDLAWSDQTDIETGFELQRRLDSGAFAILATLPAGATTYADTTATPGALHTYRVRALGGSAPSDWSAEAVATPPAESPFAAWLSTHGLPSDSAPTADPDSDGLPNLLEYALATDPADPASVSPPVLSLTASAPQALSLTFAPHRADLAYSVEASSDLAVWSPLPMPPLTVGEPVTVVDSVPVSENSRRFLRLRVNVP